MNINSPRFASSHEDFFFFSNISSSIFACGARRWFSWWLDNLIERGISPSHKTYWSCSQWWGWGERCRERHRWHRLSQPGFKMEEIQMQTKMPRWHRLIQPENKTYQFPKPCLGIYVAIANWGHCDDRPVKSLEAESHKSDNMFNTDRDTGLTCGIEMNMVSSSSFSPT